MCWADCPALQPFSCTVGCASSFESCTDAIVEIVESVLSFITSLVKLITTGGTSLLLDVAKGALKGVVKEVADASLCALGVDLHISAIEPHLTNDIIDHVANAIKNITKDVRQSLRGELETVLVEKYGPAITEHVLGMAASHLAVASIMPEEVMDLEPACTNSMTRAILHKSYNKLDMTLDIAEAMDPVGLVAMIRTFTQYGKCPSAALPQSCAEADNACGGGTCSAGSVPPVGTNLWLDQLASASRRCLLLRPLQLPRLPPRPLPLPQLLRFPGETRQKSKPRRHPLLTMGRAVRLLLWQSA